MSGESENASSSGSQVQQFAAPRFQHGPAGAAPPTGTQAGVVMPFPLNWTHNTNNPAPINNRTNTQQQAQQALLHSPLQQQQDLSAHDPFPLTTAETSKTEDPTIATPSTTGTQPQQASAPAPDNSSNANSNHPTDAFHGYPQQIMQQMAVNPSLVQQTQFLQHQQHASTASNAPPQAAQVMFAAFLQQQQQQQQQQQAPGGATNIGTTDGQAQAQPPPPLAAVSTPTVQQPTFVNAKQFHRIIKRRETRAILQEHYRKQVDENQKKAYQHESRHRHAMKRPRGKHGRFLRKEELPAYYAEHPEEDPSNPENLKRMQREMDEAVAAGHYNNDEDEDSRSEKKGSKGKKRRKTENAPS